MLLLNFSFTNKNNITIGDILYTTKYGTLYCADINSKKITPYDKAVGVCVIQPNTIKNDSYARFISLSTLEHTANDFMVENICSCNIPIIDINDIKHNIIEILDYGFYRTDDIRTQYSLHKRYYQESYPCISEEFMNELWPALNTVNNTKAQHLCNEYKPYNCMIDISDKYVWYLPTIQELFLYAENLKKINLILKKLDAEQVNYKTQCLLSSTMHDKNNVYIMSIINHNIDYDTINLTYKIRPFLKWKI